MKTIQEEARKETVNSLRESRKGKGIAKLLCFISEMITGFNRRV